MKPGLGTNRFGTEIIGMGMGVEETYGGKLTENIVQAAALDLLAEAITRIEESGHTIVVRFHDEVVIDEPFDTQATAASACSSTS